MLPERHRGLVLFNPLNKQFINEFDEFVEDESQARLFDSILSADVHSAWFESIYGVALYAKLFQGTKS